MTSVLSFGDLGCLNESAAGSLGAGMASFVRAGFPAVRGFVVPPIVLSEFLSRPEILHAMEMLRSSAEHPDEGWRALKAVFNRSRLAWNHEMDILSAFDELDTMVSMMAATRSGAASPAVYAGEGQEVLDGIKHCWLRWLKASWGKPPLQDIPAVLVRSMVDSEVSVELRKRGKGIRARAVFGLPEGLMDPAASADIYEFSDEGKLDRMETRAQSFQYVAKPSGPSKVPVAPGFREGEKMSGDMLAALAPVMRFMRESPGIGMCEVCFVSSRPVVNAASMNSDITELHEQPPRGGSVNLLEPEKKAKAPSLQTPVVAAGIFLVMGEHGEADALGEEYVDGTLLTGPLATGEGGNPAEAVAESKRRFRASAAVFEISSVSPARLKWLSEVLERAASNGIQTGVLIPGIRSSEELGKAVSEIRRGLEGVHPAPQLWARVMYPSNLFFMDALAAHTDVLLLDLDSLGRLMLGATEDGKWLPYTIPALEKALEGPLASKRGRMAVISSDLVSTPGLLEFLVRHGADILCVSPGEVKTVKHIVASVEKRMLIEQGRSVA